VAVIRLLIDEFLESSANGLLLDVRSPAEFQHGHIPNAVSLPLFSNEERKIVGTIYKQESREKAIKAGLDFFGPKMRPMVETVESIISNSTQLRDNQNVFVYCWRGGMRSAGVAWLLGLYGFKVFSLAGGYKAYRRLASELFSYPFQFKLIGGYTGSGKTKIIHELDRIGEPVIDLELLANHKGSAFGGINMPQPPTQEEFENRLAYRLLYYKNKFEKSGYQDRVIWLEDESQRIGSINIPIGIGQNMRKSPLVFLDIPFAERLDYITKEYGTYSTDKLIEATERIKKRLGGLAAKTAIEFLNQNNINEAFDILLKYYDKQYLKALHNRENLKELLIKIPAAKVSSENATLLRSKIQPI
jgi:tRNA 2-selenouridine synthase